MGHHHGHRLWLSAIARYCGYRGRCIAVLSRLLHGHAGQYKDSLREAHLYKAGSKPFRSACIRKRPLSCMILRGALQAVILLPNMRGVCFYCHRHRAVCCCPWLLILQKTAARLAGHAGRAGHRARIQDVGGAGGIRCHSTGRAVLQPVDVCCERSRCLHPPR